MRYFYFSQNPNFTGDGRVDFVLLRKYLNNGLINQQINDHIEKYLKLTHPDKNKRIALNKLTLGTQHFLHSNKLQTFYCSQEFAEFYYKMITSHNPDEMLLSDNIISKKINKHLEKESIDKKMISKEMKLDVEKMETLRRQDSIQFHSNIKDDQLNDKINKLIALSIHTNLSFSKMKQYLEEKLKELTSFQWINIEAFSVIHENIIYHETRFKEYSLIFITNSQRIECKEIQNNFVMITNYEWTQQRFA